MNKAENFPVWLTEAQRLNLDVNDYLDFIIGFISPVLILPQVLFPFITPDGAVLEIGPGTGRVSRQIIKHLSDEGKLYLCDHSAWIMEFLNNYFSSHNNVICCQITDGSNLTVTDESIDTIFSHAVFVELSSLQIYDLLKDSHTKLKPSGHMIFSFNSISSDFGKRAFRQSAGSKGRWNHFYTDDLMKFLALESGFSQVNFIVSPKCPFVTFAICKK